MRFLLAFVLSFISLFAIAQAPPMVLGGPQGIDVTRILSRNWMAIPVMTDTPAAPLLGSGWPGKGYIVHVAKANDTTVWHYTGNRWVRIGGVAENSYTKLVSGGKLGRNANTNKFLVGAATYYINGVLYNSSFTQLNGFPKTANANGRIDIVALGTTGPLIIQGTESPSPASPNLGTSRIQLGFAYYPPFDTIPTISGNGIESVFREPGVDSIFFVTKDTIIRIKDSIGISKNDTTAMLNPYKFTAANGLTKDSTVFRLGGSLNQNTSINLNQRRLTLIGGLDTTRFYPSGRVSIGGTPDSSYMFYVNGNNSRIGNLEILRTGLAGNTGAGIKVPSVDGTFEFQGSGAPMFEFKHWASDTTGIALFNNDKGIMRIRGGFANVNVPNISGNVLWITPSYRFPTLQSGTKVRGIYYNPSLFSAPAGIAHIAYENTTGSNILNSTSGNTRIGYNTSDTTYKLDVNGNTNVNGSSRIQENLFVGSGTAGSDQFVINTASANFPLNLPGIWRRIGNPYSTYFMESNQGGAKDKWAFVSSFGGYDSVPRSWVNDNSSIVNINLGWASPNQSNRSASTLLIDPRINIDSTGNGYNNITMRGIYYNPKLNKLDNTTHIAYQNTTGSNILNSTSGNTRIGYNTNDTTYKLDVNGRSRITSELTVGPQDRSSALAPFANIFSDKEIISEDGFILQSPSNSSRIKTGMDADLSTNILRLWAGNANIVSMDYVGGGTNKSNLLINDNHNTGAGASGDVNTLTVSGNLTNLGLNTTVHNQINIKPNITDSFGIGLFRGIFYNPNINFLGYDIKLKHTAFQNTIGNNLLNSTSGNTRIGYNTNDTTYKLDVNGSARINGNGQKLIFTNDNGQVIIGTTNGESAGSFGDVVIGFNSKSLGVNGGQAIGFQSTAKEKGVAIGTAGAYAIGGVAIGKYSTAESGEFVVGGVGPEVDPFIVKNVYFGSGKNRARYIQSGDSLTYRPGGGDTCTINGSGGNGTNQNGGGIIIAGGKGTGAGTPGYIGFSTSTTTGSGTALQTLTERARISERGNLLVGTSTDDTSSLVNIVSTAKGFLQPRMTNTQRDAITTPATGLQLFSTTDSANYVYRGTGGGWQKIANEISGSATLDFPSTNNGNESDLTITVTGASEGDVVALGIQNSVNLNHSCFTAWVSASGQVTVRFSNYGTGSLDPVSATFKVKVFK